MTVNTVVTGLGWMGTGIRSVQSALREMLQNSRQEVLLCAYSVSGGAGAILDELENALKRGTMLTIVINRFSQQPKDIQKYLLYLAESYSYCQIYTFNDPVEELHSKFVVVDRTVALVGSANISMRGMKQNYELGVLLTNTEVNAIAKCFDDLLTFPAVSKVLSNY